MKNVKVVDIVDIKIVFSMYLETILDIKYRDNGLNSFQRKIICGMDRMSRKHKRYFYLHND